MNRTKLVIEVNHDQHIEIEEYCHNKGMDFGNYFMTLHEADKKRRHQQEIDDAVEKFKNSPEIVELRQTVAEIKKEKKKKNE